jgi:hypothetical protein
VPILSAGSCRREWNRAEAGALGCPAPPNPAWRSGVRPSGPSFGSAGGPAPAPGGMRLQRAPPEDPPTGSAASGSRQEAVRAGGTRPGRTTRHIPLRHLLAPDPLLFSDPLPFPGRSEAEIRDPGAAGTTPWIPGLRCACPGKGGGPHALPLGPGSSLRSSGKGRRGLTALPLDPGPETRKAARGAAFPLSVRGPDIPRPHGARSGADPGRGQDPGRGNRGPRGMTMRHWITSFRLLRAIPIWREEPGCGRDPCCGLVPCSAANPDPDP